MHDAKNSAGSRELLLGNVGRVTTIAKAIDSWQTVVCRSAVILESGVKQAK